MPKRGEPKSRFVVWINTRQLKALAKRSEDSGASIAELIRRALDLYLGTKKKKN